MGFPIREKTQHQLHVRLGWPKLKLFDPKFSALSVQFTPVQLVSISIQNPLRNTTSELYPSLVFTFFPLIHHLFHLITLQVEQRVWSVLIFMLVERKKMVEVKNLKWDYGLEIYDKKEHSKKQRTS